VPLIVLPKSCSCRWGPPCLSSSPIPRLASLFYFFPLRAGAPIVGLACFTSSSFLPVRPSDHADYGLWHAARLGHFGRKKIIGPLRYRAQGLRFPPRQRPL